MPDFVQQGLITTLHDLGAIKREQLESMLQRATQHYKIGLVLPVTASDMRAKPFANIVQELREVNYIDQIIVVLGVAPDEEDYRETQAAVAALGDKATVLWSDGPRMTAIYEELLAAGLNVSVPGKGRSVWTAFGYLLADPRLKAFALHDCDIVNFDREQPQVVAQSKAA